MPPPACQIAKEDLLACLLRTDCVLKSGKTPQECLQKPQELPLQCQHLIIRFSDCKKGMLDMRRRFRDRWTILRPIGRMSKAVDRTEGDGEVNVARTPHAEYGLFYNSYYCHFILS
ncbi:uncharacterized protein IAS62_002607 [Cryptococcus decagattii]|uniref:Cytochrome c oxidase assembly factor 5 n=1 Tax=Cryptococcus decagattii TaxID=1859122 RepID=A0ABZ2ATV0_9TREE